MSEWQAVFMRRDNSPAHVVASRMLHIRECRRRMMMLPHRAEGLRAEIERCREEIRAAMEQARDFSSDANRTE